MQDPNNVIIQRLITNLGEYIAYLNREYGYLITLHQIEESSNANWPKLLSYNYHACEVCRKIKNSANAWQHCVDRQGTVKDKAKDGPYKGTCFAGVSEYVFPLQDLYGNCNGFLCVSSYTLNRETSLARANAAAHKYGLSKKGIEEAVNQLKEELPDLETLKMQIMPIQNILSTLFYFNSVTVIPEDANSNRKKLYFEILTYINRRYRNSGFSLKEVCKDFNISYSYASHLFAEYNQLTFACYLRNCRIEAVKRYLEHTMLPIGYAAQECGFLDSNYFSSIFKAETGMTPSQYRAKYNKTDPGLATQPKTMMLLKEE